MVRAKFNCSGTTGPDEYGNVNVNFLAVTADTPENRAFWNATPAGRIELSISNPAAHDQFEVGKDYFIDFTPAEPAG